MRSSIPDRFVVGIFFLVTLTLSAAEPGRLRLFVPG
jgi:hypothetical protein